MLGVRFVSGDELQSREAEAAERERKAAKKAKKKEAKRKRKKERKERRREADGGKHDDSGASSDDSGGSDSDGSAGRAGKRPRGGDGDDRAAPSGDAAAAAPSGRASAGLDWMMREPERPAGEAAAKAEAAAAAAAANAPPPPPPSKVLELNTYLRDGGDGLPPDDPHGRPVRSFTVAPAAGVVGDGGASWRLKALKRAQETAKSEGRALDSVVEERWGSLGQLTASLAATRAAPAGAHRQAAVGRLRQAEALRPPGGRRGPDSDDEEVEVEGAGKAARLAREAERAKDRPPPRERDGGRGGPRDAGREGDRRGDGDRGRREDDRSGRDGDRGGHGDRSGGHHDRGGRGGRGGGRGRGGRGGSADVDWAAGGESDEEAADARVAAAVAAADREGDADLQAAQRRDRGYLADVKTDQGRMQRPQVAAGLSWRKPGGGAGGGRAGGGNGDGSAPFGRASGADADLLRAAAASINKFEADGSFLDRFAPQPPRPTEAGPAEGAAPRREELAAPSQRPLPTGEAAGMLPGRADAGLAGAGPSSSAAGLLGAPPPPPLGLPPGAPVSFPAPAVPAGAPLDNRAAAAALRARLQGKPPPSAPPAPAAATAPVAAAGAVPSDPSAAAAADAAATFASLASLARMRPGPRRDGLGYDAAAAAAAADEGGPEGPPQARTEVVNLPLVDARGRAMPGAFGRAAGPSLADATERKPAKLQRYDTGAAGGRGGGAAGAGGSGAGGAAGPVGSRVRYFADDDAAGDAVAMARSTRYEGVADMDAALARNILKAGGRFSGRELHVDAEYDHDQGLGLYDAAGPGRGKSDKQRAEANLRAQVADYKRLSTLQDRCRLCFESAARAKHLTVSVATRAYLMLPPGAPLVPGHSVIVTAAHEVSTRAADEATWEEVRNFKKCLLRLWAERGQDVIFIEQAMGLTSQRGHAYVEAIPVPRDRASRAPMIFKKAIDEAESEWSQHAAKRCIDTRAKGLRGSIPPNFPYFHVEFGLASGFVHVIDDEVRWPKQFAREVLVGVLELPPEEARRRQKPPTHAEQMRAVAEFAARWAPVDWTRQLG